MTSWAAATCTHGCVGEVQGGRAYLCLQEGEREKDKKVLETEIGNSQRGMDKEIIKEMQWRKENI